MTSFNRISVEQAKNLIDTQAVSIVDVRDPVSFQNGHIEGATLLDNNTANHFIEHTAFDNAIIVYCYHGNSSQQASQFLVEQGFTEVYSVDGGFEQWRQMYAASTQ